jgi:hypothetical protein
MGLRVVLWVLGLSLWTLSAGASVMVLPVEGTNLDPGETAAIGQMVAGAYQKERKETVIPPREVEKVIEEAGSYQAAAEKLGANEYLHVTAVRLKERVIVTATLYSADGKLLHSAKMTADSLDDMEPASERIAMALVGRKSVKQTRTLDTITKSEGRRPNRTWVEKVMGLKAGLTYPLGYGNEIAPMMNFGFNGRLESRTYFLEFGAGFTIPAMSEEDAELAYGGLYSELGFNYYLGDSNFSPYIGGGVLPRLMGRSVTNFAPFAQGGLMFFRESSTRLYLDLRVAQNVLPVRFSSSSYETDTGIYTEENRRLYPTEFTFSAGVGW